MENLSKTNNILIFITILLIAFYFGSSLLVPFTFAVLLATLVLPTSNILEKKVGLNRISSSFFSTCLIFIGVGVFSFFLVRQFSIFVNDILDRKDAILNYVQKIQEDIAVGLGFPLEEQEQMFRDKLMDLIDVTQQLLSSFLADVSGIVLNFLLVLVYVFLLLLNRGKFREFVMMYISSENEKETKQIIEKTSRVAHGYLWGRIQVMLALAVMYTITFTAYGLEHAGLLILFGTLITIIPYLGPFLSGILPIIFMIIYGESNLEIISFAIIVLIIQLIESYVLEPILIGFEVEQSPLFVIIAVLLGGALWGPAGLILFVPLFSILKIIFDRTPSLKPVGFLLGYERPGAKETLVEKIRRKIRK